MIKRICKKCNNTFYVCPSAVINKGAIFCSKECRNKQGWTIEHRRKISNGVKKNLPKTAYKKGNITWCTGKIRSEMLGNKHPNWRGGKSTRKDGYVFIYQPKHPFAMRKGYVLEHRLVMEKHIGRYLKPKEVVHHINGNPSDNRTKNLKLFKNDSKHKLYHPHKRNKLGRFMKH